MYFCTCQTQKKNTMEKQILDELKTKFEGVSETILAKMAKRLADGGKTAEDAKSVTFQQILESYGDSRATDATKTAVANYEKKHGLKDGEKVQKEDPKPNPEPEPNNDIPAWAQAIIDANKALTEKVAAMSGEKLAETRKRQLNEKLGSLPAELRKGYERIQLETMEEDAFNSFLTEVGEEVQGIEKATQVKGAVFGKPTPQAAGKTTANEATEKEVDDVLSRMNI